MVGMSRSLLDHRLIINPNHSPIMQKKRLMAKERNEIVNKEVKDLVMAGVMRAT